MHAGDCDDSVLPSHPRIVGHAELLPSEVWRLAVDDSEIPPDRTLLFVLPGESGNGNEATSWVPDTTIDAPEELEDLGELIQVANAREVQGLHRVAIWPATQPLEVRAALLRHELEHSRQFDRHGTRVRDLFVDSVGVLARFAGGMDGAGVLYQHIPMERDADAAASRFVRNLYGDAAVDSHELGHWSLLARDGHSPNPETIGVRMERFIEVDGPELAKRFALGIRQGLDWTQFRRPSP